MQKVVFEFHPSLDRDYLDMFYEDDWEYAHDMFETYLETAEKGKNNLAAALGEGNRPEMGHHVHKLRPCFMMVGLKKAFEMADEIEDQGAENYELDELKRRVKSLLEEMNESLEVINSEKARLFELIS